MIDSTDSVIEKIFNIFLGLSFLSWACLGILYSKAEDRFTIVRVVIAVLHIAIGVLIFRRISAKKETVLRHVLLSLPSLLNAGIAFKLSALPHIWPWYAQIIFLLGAIIALISFCFLGKNFAILPVLRDVSVKGPYRIVRHPVYAGEFIMIAACALSNLTILSIITIVLAVPFAVIRIYAEESVLKESSIYCSYMKKVKYRLIPLIY